MACYYKKSVYASKQGLNILIDISYIGEMKDIICKFILSIKLDLFMTIQVTYVDTIDKTCK